MLKELTDEQLMTEYRLGSEEAFTVLYERHSSKVYGYLRAKTANDALAREIFQVTFLKLHATRDRYRPDLPLLPWLFAIARNELIDTMRKKARNLEDASEWLPEVAAPPEEEEPQKVELDSLSDQQKRAVKMRYQDDLPFEKIAAKLGTSPANARQLVSRGVKALRRLYGKE
ncbi:MAG: sigma-70 family RNA polymerase sigma factor [Bdellovibrionales bacterium]|nr:sigma-70 family RNA polymerase sigma factor [Bdellovibrionales bacterium]